MIKALYKFLKMIGLNMI